ncbi:MAG: helix-turn-helix domain-containing protein [Alphaproteobacteria bacterium]|nr:helix-turn-helix domain-containing protein [Alphaproteobacteria bacterium]MCB9794814.1 helix-turn-helix domain-containing protein [Alphaproteobacteria bacterium]
MPAAHPIELRARVVEAHENGEGSFSELAERFKVGRASVNRWVALKRRTGSLKRRPTGGRRRAPLVTAEIEEFLVETLDDLPDSTIFELQAAVQEVFEVKAAYETIRQAVRRPGYTRKRGLPGRPVAIWQR